MFITILVLLLATIYFITIYHPKLNKINHDTFNQTNYSYSPIIQNPQTNYENKINIIDSQQLYKSDLSVALRQIPTVQCSELKTKFDCNNYGCNWLGTFCSSIYPTQL